MVCVNERVVSLQIIGKKRREKRFIKKVGIKSREEDLVGSEWMNLLISPRVAGENCESCGCVKSGWNSIMGNWS